MEIAKEKFIETFKKECEKASKSLKHLRLRASGSLEEPSFEVIASDNVSFFAIKMSNNDENNTYSFVGKILFSGFVDYKSIDLTNDEFNSLFESFEEAENIYRLAVKNEIIAQGENSLSRIFQ
jgi:hypothetical protein